jgi:diguanylate cyclase (GGDEF)-like protein
MVVGARSGTDGLRSPWVLLAIGQAAFVAGDLLFHYYEFVAHRDPFPSPADGLYLLGYPILALGLWRLLVTRDPGRERGTLIDALTISVGSALVTWVFLVIPLASDESLSPTGRLVAGAYPVGDLLLLALLIRVMLTQGGRTPAWRLLAGGYLLLLLADVLFAISELSGFNLERPANAGYVVAYGLAATAVLHPSRDTVAHAAPARNGGLSRGRLWGLGLASLLTPAAIAFQSLSGQRTSNVLIAVVSGTMVVLVMLRLSGLVDNVEQLAAEMTVLASVDALTHLANRRAWNEELPIRLSQSARLSLPISVAILDLDHFKAFNDTYGHPAGDALLYEAGAAWQLEIRMTDLLARYGGEEFGVILPGCSELDAATRVEKLRKATPGGQTCSAGVAQWDGHESSDELVARADLALYSAKRGGRDRLAVASHHANGPATLGRDGSAGVDGDEVPGDAGRAAVRSA